MTIRYNEKTLANTGKCIEKAIASVGKARDDVQIAYVSIVHHGVNHNDKRYLTKYAKELVAGTVGLNQKGLVDALVSQGAEVDEKAGIVGWSTDKLNLDRAKEKEWWKFKPQNPYEGYSLEDALKAVYSRANKELAKKAKWAASDDPKLVANAEQIVIDRDRMADLASFLGCK
jgi:hypothetical protein